MSYYTVTVKEIEVLGRIWMPNVVAAMTKKLRDYDIENIKARGNGAITREAVEDWLDCNAGDFQEIIDFHADIADIDIPWKSEENEYLFFDCMYPEMAEL